MGNYVIEFLLNNFSLVILFAITLILFSFKHKKIRYVTIFISALVSASVIIYLLHDINIVNNGFYYRTLEFVCLFMRLFEIMISFIFNMQSKIFENINYYNFIIIIMYMLDAFYSVDINNTMIINMFILKTYALKTKFIYKIKTHLLNLKYKLNDFSKSTVVLLC